MLLKGKDDVARILAENTRLYSSVSPRTGGAPHGSNVPWFQLYQTRFVSTLPISEHEFIQHPMACLCVIGTSHPDPVACFREIYQPAVLTEVFRKEHMHSDIPAFVILLHDPHAPGSPSDDKLRQILPQFGAHCRLVRVNSSPRSRPLKWPGVYSAFFQAAADDLVEPLDNHPLPQSFMTDADAREIEKVMDVFSYGYLVPMMERNILNLNEHVNALRRSSSTLRSWWSRFRTGRPSEAVGASSTPMTNFRLDDSGFLGSGAYSDPSIFLTLSSDALASHSKQPGYDLSKTNLNRSTKELADMLFIIGDYENSLSQYKSCMNDFKNEEEYRYYAGCLEMSAVCSIIISLINQRTRESSVETDLEKAFAYYSRANPEPCIAYATRAGFLLTTLLKNRSRFKEALEIFQKMVSQNRDGDPLRAALFSEQAALCNLQEQGGLCHFRKFTSQLVKAGQCYEAAGQRHHALGCYATAFMVYNKRGWHHIEDHIRSLMSRQMLALGYVRAATEHISFLLRPNNRQSPQQQNDNLREALYWMENLAQRGGHETPLPVAPVPQVPASSISVYLLSTLAPSGVAGRRLRSDVQAWQEMEAMLRDETAYLAQQAKRTINKYSYHYTFGAFDGNTNPIVSSIVGEEIVVEFSIVNPLHAPLQFESLQLVCSHYPLVKGEAGRPDTVDTTDVGEPYVLAMEPVVKVQSINLLLGALEAKQIRLSLTPSQEGMIRIRGIAFFLANQLWARTDFALPRIRLNRTAAHRTAPTYENDNSLSFRITPAMPRLKVEFHEFPSYLLSGEIRRCLMIFKNVGQTDLGGLKLKFSHPDSFVVGHPAHLQTPFPVAKETALPDSLQQFRYSPGSTQLGIAYLDEFVGQLAPGETRTIPLWVRGGAAGTVTYQFLFYYEPVPGNPMMPFRVLPMAQETRVHQSIQVLTTSKPSASTLGEYVISLDIQNRQQTAIFQLDQLHCLSPFYDIVPLSHGTGSAAGSPIDPILSGEVQTINPRHSALIFFKAVPKKTNRLKSTGDDLFEISLSSDSTDESKSISSISSVSSSNSSSSSSNSSSSSSSSSGSSEKKSINENNENGQNPLIRTATVENFSLKRLSSISFRSAGFSLEAGPYLSLYDRASPLLASFLSGAAPVLPIEAHHELPLLLFWRTSKGTSSLHFGQHNIAPIRLLPSVHAASSDSVSSHLGSTIGSTIGSMMVSSPSSGFSTGLLQFKLEYPSSVVHDFSKMSVCAVPVRFQLHNSSSTQSLSIVIETLRPSESKEVPYASLQETRCQYFWAGTTKQTVPKLEPQGFYYFHTFVCFTNPGSFNLNRFRFTLNSEQTSYLRNAQHIYSPQQYLISILPPPHAPSRMVRHLN